MYVDLGAEQLLAAEKGTRKRGHTAMDTRAADRRVIVLGFHPNGARPYSEFLAAWQVRVA
jgi:hypothetical protein